MLLTVESGCAHAGGTRRGSAHDAGETSPPTSPLPPVTVEQSCYQRSSLTDLLGVAGGAGRGVGGRHVGAGAGRGMP